eukprot:gnl/MRDRNA2_/MRDRNA2_72307_c0_seq1.p1 gnl/MRDRNA2_/MRDRNA2_72307_c0~~gnl/MRDRNA2_/MRDRNA2_72307_c0_seq1.p1  ORF type:complete len:454 (+),score=69.37 gnl/MRDRNA2_/MRDRNA2_72307_c0_seq1:170-1531(+)
MMKAEAELLQELDHPHIVQLFECIHDKTKNEFLLVMVLLPGGDCHQLLGEHHPISESVVTRLVQQLIIATEYCHNKGILHRDIKPENMMLTSRDLKHCEVKVIDFGICKILEKAHSKAGSEGLIIGTMPFIAPEILQGLSFDEKCDLYSIGVTAYMLLSNDAPFGCPDDYESLEDFLEALTRCKMQTLPAGRSMSAHKFCKALLHPDPLHRRNCKEAMQSLWMQGSKPRHALTRCMTESMEDFASSSYFKRACCLLIATQLTSAELHEISESFKALDKDCEGRISTSVMKNALLEQLWFWERDDARFDTVAQHVDQDGDGYVAFSEFAAASIHSQLNSSDICRHAFDALDQNGNGTISFAELVATFEKPHVKEFEKQTGVDFLDLIRPVFQGCSEVSYKEFKELLKEKTDSISTVGDTEVPIPLASQKLPPRQHGGLFGGVICNTCCGKRGHD